MNILIINGPNLNLLGKRQTDIYGNQSFEAYLDELRQMYPQHSIAYFQSNCEGAIIDRLHADGFSADAIVINAGAEMLVVISGEIMRMPGLPKEPQALHIDIVNGEIEGLS